MLRALLQWPHRSSTSSRYGMSRAFGRDRPTLRSPSRGRCRSSAGSIQPLMSSHKVGVAPAEVEEFIQFLYAWVTLASWVAVTIAFDVGLLSRLAAMVMPAARPIVSIAPATAGSNHRRRLRRVAASGTRVSSRTSACSRLRPATAPPLVDPPDGPITGETVVPYHWRNSPQIGPMPLAGDNTGILNQWKPGCPMM